MINLPFVFLAINQLKRAVLAPPTCSDPVGDGAKRTLTGAMVDCMLIDFTAFRCEREKERLINLMGTKERTTVNITTTIETTSNINDVLKLVLFDIPSLNNKMVNHHPKTAFSKFIDPPSFP